LVRVAVREAGIPLIEAIKMITLTPAKIMKLDNKGRIAPNTDADLVVFDDDINVKKVFTKDTVTDITF
jgi:N-acetylglucosamine-6-phosphate deacetylase